MLRNTQKQWLNNGGNYGGENADVGQPGSMAETEGIEDRWI